MNTENMSFEELKEYAASLLKKLDCHKLKEAIIFLEKLLSE